MATFYVTIPIAGHILVEVEADNRADAIERAFDSDDLSLTNCDSWEALRKFHSGNVCHCPSPWEIEVEEVKE
jgi:hypothetical protein